jgi:hypothetical protein
VNGAAVRVGNGRIVVPLDTYERWFGGAECAALLERDGALYLLPLRSAAVGGRLLKRRNLRGDRVIDAGDLLGGYGLGAFSAEHDCAVRWSDEVGGLALDCKAALRSQT